MRPPGEGEQRSAHHDSRRPAGKGAARFPCHSGDPGARCAVCLLDEAATRSALESCVLLPFLVGVASIVSVIIAVRTDHRPPAASVHRQDQSVTVDSPPQAQRSAPAERKKSGRDPELKSDSLGSSVKKWSSPWSQTQRRSQGSAVMRRVGQSTRRVGARPNVAFPQNISVLPGRGHTS